MSYAFYTDTVDCSVGRITFLATTAGHVLGNMLCCLIIRIEYNIYNISRFGSDMEHLAHQSVLENLSERFCLVIIIRDYKQNDDKNLYCGSFTN